MGNAFTLSGGIFPPSPPYAQRFSNGPVAAEYLAGHLGVPLAPSTVGGTNFAVGGATTGVLNFNFEINSPPGIQNFPLLATSGIAAQIASYQQGNPTFVPNRTLFMLWGGPNDLFLALAQGNDPTTAAIQAVQNLAGDVLALAQLGATQFLVPNMANLGRTPSAIAEGPEAQAGLEAVTLGFNAGLAQAMNQLEELFGLDIRVFNTFAEQSRLLEDPAAFGFTDTTTPCILTPALATGCQGFVFFDGVHPTTAAHAALAEAFFEAVVPAPASLALLLGGGVLLGWRWRRAAA
jgi:phospholipase/lecithinase/hemolysin